MKAVILALVLALLLPAVSNVDSAAAAAAIPLACSSAWESPDLQAVALAPDGTIFTANYTTGYVCHYAAAGTAISSWSLPQGALGSPFWPIGIDVDALGNVCVSDFGNRCVYKCTPEGAVLDTIGLGTLVAPRGVACDRERGHVYVCDGEGHAIREFDASGDLLRSIPADWYVSDVALGGDGGLYASAYNGRVYRLAADGSLLGTWQPDDAAPNTSFPSLVCGADGRIHVVDRTATRVLVISRDLQEIGEWSLVCDGLNLACRLNGSSYGTETLTGLDINAEGQAVLGSDCLPNQLAVFPAVPLPANAMTWGRVKTLYR